MGESNNLYKGDSDSEYKQNFDSPEHERDPEAEGEGETALPLIQKSDLQMISHLINVYYKDMVYKLIKAST